MPEPIYPKAMEARLRRAKDYFEYRFLVAQWHKREKRKKEAQARSKQPKLARKPIGCSIRSFSIFTRNRDEFAEFRKTRKSLWISFTLLDNLPCWPCCYVIYIHRKLAYIGETESLRTRMCKHRYGILSDLPESEVIIKAKLCRRYGEWAMTERRLIKRLQPPLNRKGVLSRTDGY